MNFLKITIATTIAATFSNMYFAQNQQHDWKEATSAGYTYKYVTNDPTSARYYTLKNGLTVILSPTKRNHVFRHILLQRLVVKLILQIIRD